MCGNGGTGRQKWPIPVLWGDTLFTRQFSNPALLRAIVGPQANILSACFPSCQPGSNLCDRKSHNLPCFPDMTRTPRFLFPFLVAVALINYNSYRDYLLGIWQALRAKLSPPTLPMISNRCLLYQSREKKQWLYNLLRSDQLSKKNQVMTDNY